MTEEELRASEQEEVEGYRFFRELLEMVECLHRRGYERLRCEPYCGCKPRLQLRVAGQREPVLTRSICDGREFFRRLDDGVQGRKVRRGATPEKLADLFLVAFPDLAQRTLGPSPRYTAWYRKVMRLTAPDGIIEIFTNTDPYDCCRAYFPLTTHEWVELPWSPGRRRPA
jgi:hypothetical protein